MNPSFNYQYPNCLHVNVDYVKFVYKQIQIAGCQSVHRKSQYPPTNIDSDASIFYIVLNLALNFQK